MKPHPVGLRATRVATLLNQLSRTACFWLPLLLATGPAQADVALMPGELRANIPAAGVVIADDGLLHLAPGGGTSPGEGPIFGTVTGVTFDRADSLTQNVRVYAYSNPIVGVKTATARGALTVDFCVPRSGLGTCDPKADPAAPDIVASITFGYGVVGVVNALGVGSKSTFQASASVIDLERGTYVNYQKLADLSAALGSIKTIAKVPIPIPDFADAETTLPVTFTALLKRGKRYRFQLAAASTARGVYVVASNAMAESNFYLYSLQHPLQRGRVQLRNLTVQVAEDETDVSAELASLRELVVSLQEQLGNLADQVDTLRDDVQEDILALHDQLDALAKRTDVPGSLLMLPAGSPPPEGFAFVGSFDLAPTGGSRGRPAMISVDVYRKN